MTSDIIRVQYDQLPKLAQTFDTYADSLAHQIKDLYNTLLPLQRGGYQSEESAAFFASLEQDTFVGLVRLQTAMGLTSQTITTLGTMFRSGESNAGSQIPNDIAAMIASAGGIGTVAGVVTGLISNLLTDKQNISKIVEFIRKGLDGGEFKIGTLDIIGGVLSAASDLLSGKENLGNAVAKAGSGVVLDAALGAATDGIYPVVVAVGSVATWIGTTIGKGGVLIEHGLYDTLHIDQNVRDALDKVNKESGIVFDKGDFGDTIDAAKNLLYDETLRPAVTDLGYAWDAATHGDLIGAVKNLAGAVTANPISNIISNLFDPNVRSHTMEDMNNLIIHGTSLSQLGTELGKIPVRFGLELGDGLVNQMTFLPPDVRQHLDQGFASAINLTSNPIIQGVQTYQALEPAVSGAVNTALDTVGQQIHSWLSF